MTSSKSSTTMPTAAWSNRLRKRASLSRSSSAERTRSETSRSVMTPPSTEPSVKRSGAIVPSTYVSRCP
jgi:hypothetical protein